MSNKDLTGTEVRRRGSKTSNSRMVTKKWATRFDKPGHTFIFCPAEIPKSFHIKLWMPQTTFLIMDIEKCISLTCNDKAISLFVAVDSHCICHSMEYYFHFLIPTVHTYDSQIFCGHYFETTCTRRAIPCENVWSVFIAFCCMKHVFS